jgi:hypothetical protein
MKKLILVFLLVFAAFLSQSQDKSDFVIADKTYVDWEQVVDKFQGQNSLLVLTRTSAIEQISDALASKKINDLHIFAAGKPGTIGFCNLALNLSNISGQESFLSKWAASVSGKVVIHNSSVFTTVQGAELKSKLEQITGLVFDIQ